MTGALAEFVRWTEEEDALLRVTYSEGGTAPARAALPARSEAAILHRVQRLGLHRRRRWTALDDTRLRKLWDGESPLEEIAERLGRTAVTTYWRAQQLGLPLGCPEGWEYLSHACARTGYGTGQLRRVLRSAGASVKRALAAPRKTASKGSGHVTWIVRPGEVDFAVEAWHETEPVETAARRLGICGQTLARRLLKLGLTKPSGGGAGRPTPKRHWRVRPEEIALAMQAPVGRWARAGATS